MKKILINGLKLIAVAAIAIPVGLGIGDFFAKKFPLNPNLYPDSGMVVTPADKNPGEIFTIPNRLLSEKDVQK